MDFLKALGAVLGLAVLVMIGINIPGARFCLAILAPYAAVSVFLIGVTARVVIWARSAVPFRIPTTSGQQKSLPWIKSGWLESPSTGLGVAARLALEVLLFRSLFRNSRASLHSGRRVAYGEEKFLWLGAMAFHWSLLVILLRHLRIFTDPVPAWVLRLQNLDGFFQVGTPVFYLTDGIMLAALAYLLWRRIGESQVKYISLFTDYFALCLLSGLAFSGVLMRYVARIDIVQIKKTALGLAALDPIVPEGAGSLFFIHLFLLCVLLVYFPFSKLMHMGGVFLSPTRNLRNNSRMRRHVNAWDAPVKVHSYEEWEDEYRDKIRAAGLPLERP